MEAKLIDGPSGDIYAESTSLFILLKPETVISVGNDKVPSAPQGNPISLGKSDVCNPELQASPAYNALCSAIGL